MEKSAVGAAWGKMEEQSGLFLLQSLLVLESDTTVGFWSPPWLGHFHSAGSTPSASGK